MLKSSIQSVSNTFTHKLSFQIILATKQHQRLFIILMMIQHIPCKQTLICHVAIESYLYFSYAVVLLHCIDTEITRVVRRPFILINSFFLNNSLHLLFVLKIIGLPLSVLL